MSDSQTWTETHGNMKSVNVLLRNRTPSWKRFGDGAAFLEFKTYLPGGVVNFSASETAYAQGSGRDVTKEVMFGLTLDAQRELLKFLAANIAEAEAAASADLPDDGDQNHMVPIRNVRRLTKSNRRKKIEYAIKNNL